MSYGKGFDSAEKLMTEQAAERAARSGAFNFFLKKGDSGRIVFLDNEPGALVFQYTHKVDGKFQDFICQGDPADYRDFSKRPSLVAYFTIIQIGEFEGKNGKIVNPRRVLAAKSQTLDILKRQFGKRGGLRGLVFEVSRGMGDKTPAVGDYWEFEKKLDDAELAKLNEDTSPVNFEEVLKPKERTADQLRKILQGQAEENAKSAESEEVEW